MISQRQMNQLKRKPTSLDKEKPMKKNILTAILIAACFAQAGFIFGYYTATENYLNTTPVPPMVLDDIQHYYQDKSTGE